MNKKTWSIAAIAIVLITLLVGVTSFKGNGTSEEKNVILASHSSGETEVPVNPSNVVVFDFGILDALDYLGVDVIGVAQESLPEYLSKFKDEKYKSVGTLKEPNLEKIYELQPELIIISGRQAEYYEELTKIAPTINLGVDNENYLESFKSNMQILANIFDKEKEVNEALADIDVSIKELNEKVTSEGLNALITLSNSGEISVYGETSRFGIIHQNFGFEALEKEVQDSNHGTKASFEYIAEKNPNYLFVVDRSVIAGGSGDTKAQDLFENEIMKRTDVYKNGRIVYLDPQIWYTSVGGFTSTQKMINEIMEAVK